MKKIFLSLILATLSLHVCATQRIKNCLLSAAYGDVLGRVTEFIKSTDDIFKIYPNGVRSFNDFIDSDWDTLPNNFKINKIAPYTDDTAMALLVMNVLMESKNNNYDLEKTMSLIAHAFVDDMNGNNFGWIAGFRAPGNCCIKYVNELNKKILEKNDKNNGWWKVSPKNGKTGGCGSVMHAYPFGLLFASDPQKAKIWAAEHSALTHGDNSAVASCAAMAIGAAYAVQGKDRNFIIDKMIEAAREYDFSVADSMLLACDFAKNSKNLLLKDIDILEQLKSNRRFRESHDKFFNKYLGWSAKDAIAGVIYLFALSLNTIDSIYLGVHTPGDSDSIASLAGALCGACYDSKDILGVDVKKIENYSYMCSL